MQLSPHRIDIVESQSYKRFPPGRGHLHIPAKHRDSALAGLSLYAPCRPRGIALRNAFWRLTSLLGPRALPGGAAPLAPPVAPSVWSALLDGWRASFGAFDDLALYSRTQSERSGFVTLLLSQGRPTAFLKVRPADTPNREFERKVVSAVRSAGPKAFTTPDVLGDCSVADWYAVGFEPLPPAPHGPPSQPPLPKILAEIQAGLSGLDRPPDVPEHWTPFHGDLTPWNLRRFPDGRLALIDWEDAGWAPRGADEVLYRATAHAVLGEPAPRFSEFHAEAVRFWSERTAGKEGNRRDERLRKTLRAALQVP